MQDEQRKILQMVQDGLLTPNEAETLLNALEPAAEPEMSVTVETPEQTTITSGMVDDEPPPMPDKTRARRYWEVPFAVGLILMGVSGLCLSWAGSMGLFLVGLICLWIVFITAGITTLVGWWSRSARWVHVRVREQDGHNLSISLPLPMGLAEKGLNVARRFVDETMAENLDMAASLLSMLKESPPDEPVSVEVEDEDGDHVAITIA